VTTVTDPQIQALEDAYEIPSDGDLVREREDDDRREAWEDMYVADNWPTDWCPRQGQPYSRPGSPGFAVWLLPPDILTRLDSTSVLFPW